MPRVFVGIGSNIDPEESIRRALALLGGRVRLVALSTFYRTPPLGRDGQPAFINGVAEVETDLPPRALKHEVLRAIEEALGRRRLADKYAPRTIDLDIAAYDEQAIEEDDLAIPDPEILRRPFLALPLCELAPDLVLPGLGVPIRDVAAGLGSAGLDPLPEYTAALREGLLGGQGGLA